MENGNCDWLFLAPGYDDTWPSDQAVKRIIQVLREKQYPHRYECVIYEKGSYLLGMPNEALKAMGDVDKLMRMLGKFLTMEKKYPKECMEAREESYQKILSFLRESMIDG